MTGPVSVFIVDDSAVSRAAFRRLLEGDPGIRVVGDAVDGREALRKIPKAAPDIVLMDIVMPGMDGLEATRELMRVHPKPVLVVSDQVGGNADLSFEALRAGALEVIGKPAARQLDDAVVVNSLRRKVKLLAEIPVITRRQRRILPAFEAPPRVSKRPQPGEVSLVCAGASTGGPPALQRILQDLGPAPPWPVLVVQHMTPGFTEGMVTWLRTVTGQTVVMAEDRVRMRPGTVYVAADGKHLEIQRGQLRLSDDPPRRGHRPSVDVLFGSIAHDEKAQETVALLLTGMGEDGALGLASLRDAGAWTIAQDEGTSVVFGMPRAAQELDGACEVLPIEQIAGLLATFSKG